MVTATEWKNFFDLRLDSKTVQPEMVLLAQLIKREISLSTPMQLEHNEWHLPYVEAHRSATTGKLSYRGLDGVPLTLEEAKIVSASCCAQVSYRNLDASLEKAKKIVERLADRDDPHLSPFEHQAMPMRRQDSEPELWSNGVTHMDRKYNFWSANFKGWIQNRQLMEV